jgi:lysophospholipase L1-like esterase
MTHVVLLGDSVFDNAPYVPAGGEVVAALRRRLPPGWRATLLARDGAVLAGVREQAGRVPPEATHLVVSAGGNDALGWTSLFGDPVASVGEALARVAAVRREFARRYAAMLDEVGRLGRPVAICTIYDVRFPDPAFREVALAALALLNDAITREAGRRGLPLLDLRTLLDEDEDFANPIEPSAAGSEKLAQAVLAVVGRDGAERSGAARRAWIVAGP